MSLQVSQIAIEGAGTLVTTSDWVQHTGVSIPHPSSRVWRAFRDIRTWYTEYKFEVVSGAPYRAGVGLVEGQVIKVTPLTPFPRASNSDDAGSAEYFLQKTMKIVPRSEIVMLLSGGPAYDFRRYTQFYIWKIAANGQRSTRISVDSYGEADLRQPLRKAKYAAYRDELTRNFYRSWAAAFAQLKKNLDAKN